VPVTSAVLSDRVHFVQENPADPNLVLIALSAKTSQLALMDPRTPRIVSTFGWMEVRTAARFVCSSGLR